MKANNRIERECMSISQSLSPLTEKQKNYAFQHCFKHQAVCISQKNGIYLCLDCGQSFQGSKNAKRVICPHCHQKLTTDGVKRLFLQYQTFQLITVKNDWQIIRTFFVKKWTRQNSEAQFFIEEGSQRFMKPGQKDVVIARNLGAYGCDFLWNTPMSIKRNVYNQLYDIWATVIYPYKRFLPFVKRNGYCQWLSRNIKFSSVFHLLQSPHYETLAKCQRFDIWENVYREYIEEDYWFQIKMIMRNNYYPDLNLWIDTLRMGKNLGFDIRSPKYVMPTELQHWHDSLVRKQNKKNRLEEIRKHNEEDMLYQEKYKAYLSKIIIAGDIVIRPLQNYAEFFDEGETMHHCVASYFNEKKSLILTARCHGSRVATIEFSLEDFEVKQCRSFCNDIPKQYDLLVKAVNDNRNLFRNTI